MGKAESVSDVCHLFLHSFCICFTGVTPELHCFKQKVYVLLSLFSLCTTKYLGGYSNKCTQFYFVECPMA